MNARLYLLDVTPLYDGHLFEIARRAVPQERFRKADSFRQAGDRCRSIGASLLLAHALAEAGVCNGTFAYNPWGKPYLAGDERVFFNLSHSGDYAICAVSDREVGCDLEKMRDRDITVAERCFAPEEYRDILSAGDERARRELLFRYWALKESFLKATGRGMSLAMRDFCIRRGKEITVSSQAVASAYRFWEYTGIAGYACAVCAEGQEALFPEVRQVCVADVLAAREFD